MRGENENSMKAIEKSFDFDTLDRGTTFVKLTTPIDEHEITALAVEAAKANRDIEELETARGELNAKIKEKREVRDEALTAVGTGKREKEVQCEVGYDWANRKRYTRRLDTGELVNPDGDFIPDEEIQLQLEGFDAATILAQKSEDEAPDASEFDGEWNESEHPEDETDEDPDTVGEVEPVSDDLMRAIAEMN